MAKATSDTKNRELVELALAGLDAQIRELNEKKTELLQLLEGGAAAKRAPKAAGAPRKAREKEKEAETGKKKRVFSAATRKKLREAAKARWARDKEPQAE